RPGVERGDRIGGMRVRVGADAHGVRLRLHQRLFVAGKERVTAAKPFVELLATGGSPADKADNLKVLRLMISQCMGGPHVPATNDKNANRRVHLPLHLCRFSAFEKLNLSEKPR